MSKRETTWDEEDTTTGRPLLPDFGGQSNEYLGEFELSKLFNRGVDGEIETLTEVRRTVNRLVSSVPPIKEEHGQLIVPVAFEKMVLVKRIVLVEELVLTPNKRKFPPKN